MAAEQALVNRLIENAIAFLRQRLHVPAILLFGSPATGETDEWSDIDIAIFSPQVEDMGLMDRVRLMSDLRLAEGLELEPLLFPEWALHIPPKGSFAEHIIKTGKRIG
ncbi:MAG: nucleotidyltransferase domain-containing protein [Armatimonadota bacterium]